MSTIVASIFLDKVADLEPEPLPAKVMKTYFIDGKRLEIAVDRKTKGAK